MSEKKEEIEGRGKRRNCRHKFRARKHSSVPDRGDKEKLRVTTIALKSDGKKKSVGGREREREREALVGGQRSLEFHTWINSPSSGECTPPPRPTSSRFPTPARARGLGATTNSEIHPVQPLMNVRAACDITFPPPISIDTRTREVHDNQPPGRSSPERKGVVVVVERAVLIVLNLLRPELSLPLSASIHLVIRADFK